MQKRHYHYVFFGALFPLWLTASPSLGQCGGLINSTWTNSVKGSLKWCMGQQLRRCPPGALSGIGGADGFIIEKFGRQKAEELVVHACHIPLNGALLNISTDLGPACNAENARLADRALAIIESDLKEKCGIKTIKEEKCDKLLRGAGNLNTSEVEYVKKSCCANQGISFEDANLVLRRHIENTGDNWSDSCVMERLCRYDPQIVTDLREGILDENGVRRDIEVDSVDTSYEIVDEYDGQTWTRSEIPRAGGTNADGRGFEIFSHYDCDRAAVTFVHEYTHVTRRHVYSPQAETEATVEDLKAQNFLENGRRTITPRQRQCAAFLYDANVYDYGFSSDSDEHRLERDTLSDGVIVIDPVTETGTFREAVSGDRVSTGWRSGEARRIDFSSWNCAN